MTGQRGGRSDTTTYDLEDLVRLVRDGRIRIPHFQRGYRWELEDVRRLFDSILRGYPVGSFLLWDRPAPAATVTLGALTIRAPEASSALWVVDGQQRITSLVNALSPEGFRDDRFGLAYDLTTSRIESRRRADDVESVPLPVLFDLPRLLSWFQERPAQARHLTEVNDVATALRKFEFPAYVVTGAEPAELRDIFDRMNNYGKRLSRAEVFSALNAPDEERAGTDLTLGRIAERIDATRRFGRIDDDTVLRAVLARRGPDVTREIRAEFDAPGRRRGPLEWHETRDEAYERAEQALGVAVGFLQDEAGIPHLAFLPYRFLIVVLVRYFAHFPDPAPRDLDLLVRWFWRTAMAGPGFFKGGIVGATTANCSRIRPGSPSRSVQGLLDTTEGMPVTDPVSEPFRTNTAATRIVLSALWANRPRSLETGAPVPVGTLLDGLVERSTAREIALQIVPRRLLPEGRPGTLPANRILMPDVPEVFDDPGHTLLRYLGPRRSELWAPGRLPGPDTVAAVLASYALDEACLEHLEAGRYPEFLERREQLLRGTVDAFLRTRTGAGLEDTPPLSSLDLDDWSEDDDGAEDGDDAG